MDLVLNMARPITTTPEAKLKAHTDKIRQLLASMDRTAPYDAQELLRLSALISYELQHINGLNSKP